MALKYFAADTTFHQINQHPRFEDFMAWCKSVKLNAFTIKEAGNKLVLWSIVLAYHKVFWNSAQAFNPLVLNQAILEG